MHPDIVNPLNTEQIVEQVGREFVHGLTRERTACLSEITIGSSCQNATIQNWAISLYNERGSYYIRKVWEEMMKANPNPEKFPTAGFPEGTVAVKLLFTQASPAQVPFLENSKTWWADIYRSNESKFEEADCKKSPESCFAKMRLLQVDVAVRDDRQEKSEKSSTGWVFATFTYNKDAEPFINYSSSAAQNRANPWLRLDWIGLMFGNDPNVPLGKEIKQSIINRDLKIPQHLGCGQGQEKRLNGPVDNPVSSCISCHAQSETPKNLDVGNVPYGDMKCGEQKDIDFWFKNINPRSSNPTFTKDYVSLDYSLQLREGIRRYCVENQKHCGLTFTPDQKQKVVTKSGVFQIN